MLPAPRRTEADLGRRKPREAAHSSRPPVDVVRCRIEPWTRGPCRGHREEGGLPITAQPPRLQVRDAGRSVLSLCALCDGCGHDLQPERLRRCWCCARGQLLTRLSWRRLGRQRSYPKLFGDRGEIRSCAKVAQLLPNAPQLRRPLPMWAMLFFQSWPDFANNLTNFDQTWLMLAALGPTLAKLDRAWPTLPQIWHQISKFDRSWRIGGNMAQTPEVAEFGPNLGSRGSGSASVG